MSLEFVSFQERTQIFTCNVKKLLNDSISNPTLEIGISVHLAPNSFSVSCFVVDSPVTRNAITQNTNVIWDNIRMDLRNTF
jgi:hypothetical protein